MKYTLNLNGGVTPTITPVTPGSPALNEDLFYGTSSLPYLEGSTGNTIQAAFQYVETDVTTGFQSVRYALLTAV